MQNNIISALFVGQNLLTLKEVDSTNNFLKDLLSNSKPLPEGTVIMAENQFAGRGQKQNKWYSEPGKNLTFSLLLQPSFLAISNQFDLNRVVSLGVFDALVPLLGHKLKIKWPNDIYYDDKKLGGILIENIIQGETLKNSVIGIGLNVNQNFFPEDALNAVSVAQILQREYGLQVLLAEVCYHIEGWYLQLKGGKIAVLRNAYLNRLYWLNQQKKFKNAGAVFEGAITGVTDNGLLVLHGNNGCEKKFSLKEIEFINK